MDQAGGQTLRRHAQRNLAAQQPEKLKELQAVFIEEAIKNNVLPIDDRRYERFNPAIAGRPDLLAGRKSLTVY
jgi:arylsulfatase